MHLQESDFLQIELVSTNKAIIFYVSLHDCEQTLLFSYIIPTENVRLSVEDHNEALRLLLVTGTVTLF